MLGQPWKGYYLTAYGIAVKHGFKGTEEDWLASLKGEPGAKVQLRFSEETNCLEWKSEDGGNWEVLMYLSDLQTDVSNSVVARAMMAAEDAKDASAEARVMANTAITNAGKAEAAERNILQNILQYGSVVNNAYVLGDTLCIATNDGKVFTAGNVRGPKGDTGDNGVHIGAEAPKDPEKNVWIDTSEMAELSDVQKILDKLEYTDEGVQVDLSGYATKAYADAGDTSLKEFYDEPKEVAVKYSNRARFFTITENTFDEHGPWDGVFPDCFAYADLMGSARIVMTALVSTTFDWRMRFDRYPTDTDVTPVTPTITVTVNGEAIVADSLSLLREATWEASIRIQSGDTVTIAFSDADGSTCTSLYCSGTAEYKAYFPSDFATRSETPTYIEIKVGVTLFEDVLGCNYFILYFGDRSYITTDVYSDGAENICARAFFCSHSTQGLYELTIAGYPGTAVWSTEVRWEEFDMSTGDYMENYEHKPNKIIGVKLPL